MKHLFYTIIIHTLAASVKCLKKTHLLIFDEFVGVALLQWFFSSLAAARLLLYADERNILFFCWIALFAAQFLEHHHGLSVLGNRPADGRHINKDFSVG